MKSNEFRIIEHSNFCKVQRKSTYTITKGFLWWKRVEVVESWLNMGCSPNEFFSGRLFDNLEDAKKYIDDYLKYPIYHSIKH